MRNDNFVNIGRDFFPCENLKRKLFCGLVTMNGSLNGHMVVGMECHFPGGRETGRGYPVHAIGASEFLSIRNLAPDRWPAGNPTGGFAYCGGSPFNDLSFVTTCLKKPSVSSWPSENVSPRSCSTSKRIPVNFVTWLPMRDTQTSNSSCPIGASNCFSERRSRVCSVRASSSVSLGRVMQES